MRKILLLMWLPMLLTLYPLPPQRAASMFADIDHSVTAPARAGADPTLQAAAATLQAGRRAYLVRLWLEWELGAATLLGGSLVGWLAWRNRPRWQLWVAVWGLLFIGEVVWEYSGYHHRIPAGMLYFATACVPLRLLQANWWLAMFAVDAGQFRVALWMLYYGFLIPLLELVALIWLVWRNRARLICRPGAFQRAERAA